MNSYKHLFPVEKMARIFRVSKSAYYKWCKHPVAKWDQVNARLLVHIKDIHGKSRQTYGSPRIADKLTRKGIKVSRPRVARLMKQARIRSVLKKKYVVTTDSQHSCRTFENLVDRNFTPGTPGRIWVSDITYIPTKQGWAYLTTVIDIGDRNVIGWNVSKSLRAQDTVVPAWNAAVATRPITQALVLHSDRGIQYACDAFTNEISRHKHVNQSMSGKGDCWDNAVAESFFKTLKAEWVDRFTYQNHEQLALSLFDYIETFYNTQRAHSALGYLSPQQYAAELINNPAAD
ncbi:MAG: IS3 family transposase [Cyclonatronaceae bacterium]